MKKNNHGYTFVELMITIAIFSVVMVGIASIMSNASQAYKRGLFENQVQQDAQISVNQIADIICDASTQLAAGSISPADYGFKIKNTTTSGTTEESIYFKKLNNKLYVSKNKDLEFSEWQVIADNVESFQIVNNSGTDNLCEVNLTIKEDTATYSATKEVHFRNDFEFNPYLTALSSTSTTPDPDPDESGFAGTINVNRGDQINLTADYGYGIYSLSSDAETYFEITNGTCFEKNYYTLKVNDSYVNPGNFGIQVAPSESIYLVKKNDAGAVEKKYKLSMDKVEISAESGILLLTPDNVNVNAGGNTTYISCKGINVNGFLSLTGATGGYVITLDSDGIPLAGTNSNIISKTLDEVDSDSVSPYTAGADSSDQFKQGGNPVSFNINLSADKCSNGMAITTGNSGFKGNTDLVKNKNPKANIVITFEKSSQSKTYTIDYNIQTTNDQNLTSFN